MRAGIFLFSAAAIVGGAALSAHAAPGTAKLTPKAAEAVKKARELEKQKPKKILRASGLKAAKDGDNGALRAPTPEEDAALGSTSGGTFSLRVNPDGSLSATLGDEGVSDLVVVKNPDGTFTSSCSQPGHGHAAPATPKMESK